MQIVVFRKIEKSFMQPATKDIITLIIKKENGIIRAVKRMESMTTLILVNLIIMFKLPRANSSGGFVFYRNQPNMNYFIMPPPSTRSPS